MRDTTKDIDYQGSMGYRQHMADTANSPITQGTHIARTPRVLLLAAFFSGLGVLVIEVTAFRLVAPYFGTSIFITTNILGIIMAALAIGYSLGGKLADASPKPQAFAALLLTIAIVDAVIPLAGIPLFSAVSRSITVGESSLILVSFLGSLLIFFIPFVLMGMVSPFLIRLAQHRIEDSGRIAGRIFAWSTLGSLVGTFLPPIMLIPLIGTRRTIIIVALLIAVTSLLFSRRWFVWTVIGGLVLALFLLPTSLLLSHFGILEEKETAYSFIRVSELPDGLRILEQDDPFSFQSAYRPGADRIGFYYDRVIPAAYFSNKKNQNALIIGNAAGSLARQLHRFLPDRTFDVVGVDLESEVNRLGASWFDVQPGDVRAVTMDGRVALADTEAIGTAPFDVIVVDAYRHISIPPHLSTTEFFAATRNRLAQDGVLVVNINTTSTEEMLYRRMLATIQSQFAHTWSVPVPDSFNIEIFATNGQATLSDAQSRIPPEFGDIKSEITDSLAENPQQRGIAISTDDRPLTEIYTDLMILKYLMVGARDQTATESV